MKEDATEYSPWLHNAQNAGISKKKKTKQLSRQQKLRQQKGLEHGERNNAKLEKKVADSKKQSRKIQERAKAWDELNEQVEAGNAPKVDNKSSENVVLQAKGKAKRKGDGAKEMEGVEMFDVSHPSLDPVVAEEKEQEDAIVPLAMSTSAESGGKTGDALDDVDEVT